MIGKFSAVHPFSLEKKPFFAPEVRRALTATCWASVSCFSANRSIKARSSSVSFVGIFTAICATRSPRFALVVKMRDAQILQGHSVVRLASCRHSLNCLPSNVSISRSCPSTAQLIGTWIQCKSSTVTSEGVILSDADVDIQVAGNTAVFTHLALIGETQTSIVRHAGRHGHADITGDTHTTMTKAGRTRIFDNGTMSLATLAWAGGHHLAEAWCAPRAVRSLTMAVGALCHVGTLLAAGAGAFPGTDQTF